MSASVLWWAFGHGDRRRYDRERTVKSLACANLPPYRVTSITFNSPRTTAKSYETRSAQLQLVPPNGRASGRTGTCARAGLVWKEWVPKNAWKQEPCDLIVNFGFNVALFESWLDWTSDISAISFPRWRGKNTLNQSLMNTRRESQMMNFNDE